MNRPYLWLKAHIQKPICLIQHKAPDVADLKADSQSMGWMAWEGDATADFPNQ